MNISPEQIINTMFNPQEIVCLRAFDDKKSTGGAETYDIEAGRFSSILQTLKELNSKNKGIFFCVNFGGHTDASISRINAQFIEMDDKSFEEQMDLIDAFELPPSLIIKTRKSLHTYWLMDSSAEVGKFRSVQKGLIKHFNADPAVVNESRVMRLPGFYHCKKDPVMVECISFHPEHRYSQQQLIDVLGITEETQEKPPVMEGRNKGIKVVESGCLFIKHCKEHAKTLPEPLWYALLTNLSVFEGGRARIHELSSSYPGYSKNETDTKINHFLNSGTKPMTCSVIAERGFKCPNLKDGKCKVKSPCALCYHSPDIFTLRELIKRLPVEYSMIEDFNTASKFVEDYMYATDSSNATILINETLKERYNFKRDYLKILIQAQKDAHKQFLASDETRNSHKPDNIPEWYSITQNGLRLMPGILASHLSKDKAIIYAAEQYYALQAGVYREMSELEAQRIVQENMLATECKMNQIVDVEKQWRLLVQKSIKELNVNPYIINVRNGLYNVLDDTLKPHTRDYYSTVQMNVLYNKDADCPKFKEFLKESMGGDMEQVALIQEMLGYFLVPISSAQKCFVIVGVASAGKSVLLNVLNDILLGERNVSNVSWQALNERFKTAELFGKLANIFADLPTKNIDDNGIFKALVGADYLTVEKKHKNPFSFKSCARLLFSCNSIPKNYGDKSEGFYRRLIIIRFNHAVPPERRDPNILEKFRAEADGIFQFALEGLRRLMSNQFVFSETRVNAEELQRYREESNSVLSFFKECCTEDENAEIPTRELYTAYKAYCQSCGLIPCSEKKFKQETQNAWPTAKYGKDKFGKRRTWRGIQLCDELD